MATNKFTQAQEEPDNEALALRWRDLESRVKLKLRRDEVLAILEMQGRAQAWYSSAELIALVQLRRKAS